MGSNNYISELTAVVFPFWDCDWTHLYVPDLQKAFFFQDCWHMKQRSVDWTHGYCFTFKSNLSSKLVLFQICYMILSTLD